MAAKTAGNASEVLLRDYTHKITLDTPLDMLVLAMLAEDSSFEAACKAMRAIQASFVNLNDMRVARWAEVARILDPLPDSDRRARNIRSALNRIFEYRGLLDLNFLAEFKVPDARKRLADLAPELPKSAHPLILAVAAPGGALPASPEGVKMARKHGLIGRAGLKPQLQKKLAAELSPLAAAQLTFFLEMEASGGGRSSKAKE